MTERRYHKHISADAGKTGLKIREALEYKDLILLLAKREFVLTYKQTILGPFWYVLYPLLSSAVYLVIFSKIAGIGTDGAPAFLFYLAGNAMWTYFSGCFTSGCSIFSANAELFGKVYFPRLVIPAADVLIEALSFGIEFLVAAAIAVMSTVKGEIALNPAAWLLIPLLLLQLGLLGMGCGMIVSSVTTKYRDLMMLVRYGITLWMYATPVVYPLSQLGRGPLRTLIMLNPVSAPMELFRYAVLGTGTTEAWHILYCAAAAAALFLSGTLIFNRTERTFMDHI